MCSILQVIDSARFMTSLLSHLVNNFSKGVHRTKCKFGNDDKKCESCGIKYKYKRIQITEYKYLC